MTPKRPMTKLVAELGINHNGDLESVRSMMHMTKAAYWDCVKFQKRNVDVTTPPDKKDMLRDTPWGRITYLEYKRHLELTERDYTQIQRHSRQLQLPWFASPWDVDSVNFVASFTPAWIKVASAMLTDFDVLEAIRTTKIPVIISTGMSMKDEFDAAYTLLHDQVEYILACTSSYPSAAHEQNLEFIRTLKREYPNKKIGFSNHNPGILFAAAAVCFGAEMIEAHVTLDRAMYGSDQAASIEPEGMFKLAKYVWSLEQGIGNGEWIVWPSEREIMHNLRWKAIQ